MTKAKLCQALKTLIDTNKLNLEVTEWVEQDWRSTYGTSTARWKAVQLIQPIILPQ